KPLARSLWTCSGTATTASVRPRPPAASAAAMGGASRRARRRARWRRPPCFIRTSASASASPYSKPAVAPAKGSGTRRQVAQRGWASSKANRSSIGSAQPEQAPTSGFTDRLHAAQNSAASSRREGKNGMRPLSGRRPQRLLVSARSSAVVRRVEAAAQVGRLVELRLLDAQLVGRALRGDLTGGAALQRRRRR